MIAPPPSAPLRVLHVTTTSRIIAGTERLLVDMARLADRRQWALALCTLSARDALHFMFEAERWETSALGMKGVTSLPATLERLRREIAVRRPDIVHVHLSHAAILGAVALHLTGRRRPALVQTRHYSNFVARFRPRRLFLDAWAARQCDQLIAVSDAAKAQLVDVERVATDRVTVVVNGVDWDALSALDHCVGREKLKALGVPDGKIIGCAASFNVRKGHTHLLQAIPSILQHFPDTELALFGTGEDEARVRAEALALGIHHHVHFLGHRSDVHALIAGLDVYVQPSIEEGFGLAVIEAMATRRPVVGTAVGGMLETIIPNKTGLRVRPADSGALATAIVDLLGNAEHAAQLAETGSRWTRERYSIQQMIRAYDNVYREALARRSHV